MNKSSAHGVKRERKKSLFLQEIILIFRELSVDPRLSKSDAEALSKVFVNRVDLSADGGICYVFFATYKEPGQEIFNEAFKALRYFSKTMRHAFAQRVQARYTPNFIFLYDAVKEKERRIEELLDRVAAEIPKDDKPET